MMESWMPWVLLLQTLLLLGLCYSQFRNRRREKRELTGTITIAPALDDQGRAACLLTLDRRAAGNLVIRETKEAAAAAPDSPGPAPAEKPVLPSRVTHDLNQPLNSIKMTSGGILFLLNQGNPVPEEELRQCLQEISGQADRMASIIKTLKQG